jgi:hypothetical protein
MPELSEAANRRMFAAGMRTAKTFAPSVRENREGVAGCGLKPPSRPAFKNLLTTVFRFLRPELPFFHVSKNGLVSLALVSRDYEYVTVCGISDSQSLSRNVLLIELQFHEIGDCLQEAYANLQNTVNARFVE